MSDTSKKPKKSKEATIRSIKLTENTKLGFNSFKTDDGTLMVNVRKFYRTTKNPEWKPAAQGITFPVDKAKKLRLILKETCENAEEEAIVLPPRKKED